MSGGDAAAACGRPPSRAHAQDCESVKLPGCQPGVPRLQAAAFWGGQSKPAVAVGPVELTIEFGDCCQPVQRDFQGLQAPGAASPNAARSLMHAERRSNSPRSLLAINYLTVQEARSGEQLLRAACAMSAKEVRFALFRATHVLLGG